MTTSKRIAISYSQAGDAEGAGRRREAEHRIPWEPWGGVVRRSGRTFKPRVRGSSPRAGTTFLYSNSAPRALYELPTV